MKLVKLTEAQFNARSAANCTQPGKKPTIKVFCGDVPTRLTFDKYDLDIPANKYRYLVFIPCQLVTAINWAMVFNARTITNLKGDRIPRTIPAGKYVINNDNIYELENDSVLFGF